MTIHGLANQERELERFRRPTRVPWSLRASDAWRLGFVTSRPRRDGCQV